MRDMKEEFEALKELRTERREKRFEENMRILSESKEAGFISYEERNDGTVLLFRDKRKPKVDFYPGTGRWKFNNQVRERSKKVYIMVQKPDSLKLY